MSIIRVSEIFGPTIQGEGALIGQGIGGILFGLLGLFLALRLVDDYESGKADPDRPSGPSLMRRREDAPMSSPRP